MKDNNQGENSAYWIGKVKFKDGTILQTEPFYSYDNGFKVWSAEFSAKMKDHIEWIDCDKFSANQFKVSLPSDQEIQKAATEFSLSLGGSPEFGILKPAFEEGAKWLRSQEGKKEGKWHS